MGLTWRFSGMPPIGWTATDRKPPIKLPCRLIQTYGQNLPTQKHTNMPPETLLDPEEDYASSEDSDFAPEEAAERESTPSEDEAEAADATPDQTTATTTTSKRKRQAGDDHEAEDAGFENSGDEAVIGRGKKRLKRAAARHHGDDDEGGEGGLIKTRSQRAQEKVEKKYAAVKGPVTIDVDALWQQMLSDAPVPLPAVATTAPEKPGNEEAAVQESPSKGAAAADAAQDPDAMIRIRRTYNFAGKVHTEEKLVARGSAEAKLYLASQGEADPAAAEDDAPPRRMPRKAFRSVFEPVTDQLLRQPPRPDLNLGMGVLRKARELATRAEARKLNTVEKSRMDWAGYVDKEGIKDELELAGKSKTSFVGRQDFLARSEARREEEARRARLAGKV